jgi:protein involved in polysaccharide export with SLBB domain
MSTESLLTAAAKRCVWLLLCASACGMPAGCSDQVRQPTSEELALFEADEAAGPSVDMDRVLQAKITTGPYHTAIGDVLQLEMPSILNSQSFDAADADGRETYACRIGDDGTIVLPVVGPFVAAGKSLAEIETGVLAVYYPKYIQAPCPIYVSVLQYNTRQVSVVGAVAQPGVYSLRPDQMSLVALLMEAGGIVQRGAAVIRIARRNADPSQARELKAFALPRGADRQSGIRRPQGRSAEPTGPARGMTFQASFEREGPLKTTGWLAVEDQNRTVIRRWCDLASDSQTSAFIHAVAATSEQAPVDDLQRKVARLARALEPLPLGSKAGAAARDCGWQVDGERFQVLLGTSAVKKQIPSGRGLAVRAVESVNNEEAVTTIVLPIKGLNIPFSDVALQEGDTVVVEWPQERLMSVLGLVRNPGNFPYPQNDRYNLIQAIGFAGGLDAVADPRYVTIYRLQPDGEIANVTVQLVNPRNESDLTTALALPVKPGDVISVEHTLRTRTNVFFERYFRITFGLFVDPRDLWQND